MKTTDSQSSFYTLQRHEDSIDCSLWNPSNVERIVLTITMETLALLSLFGSGFVILTYGVFRARLRHFLPFWFSISAFLLAVFVLMSPLSGFQPLLTAAIPCRIQAYGIQFFSNATNFWSLIIFLHMHGVIVGQSEEFIGLLSSLWAHLFVWGCSAILTIIPAALGLFGPSGPWCWLKCAKYAIWGVAFFFAEMLVIVLIQVILWIRMFRALREMQKAEISLTVKSASSTLIHRCTWFVWLNFFLFLAMASYRVFEILAPNLVVYILELFDALAISSMGLLLSFCVFGLTRENHRLWMYYRPSCFARQDVLPYSPAEKNAVLAEPVNEFTHADQDHLLPKPTRYEQAYPIPKPIRNLRNDRSFAGSPGSLSETSESDTVYLPEVYGSYGTMAGVNFKEVEFASG